METSWPARFPPITRQMIAEAGRGGNAGLGLGDALIFLARGPDDAFTPAALPAYALSGGTTRILRRC